MNHKRRTCRKIAKKWVHMHFHQNLPSNNCLFCNSAAQFEQDVSWACIIDADMTCVCGVFLHDKGHFAHMFLQLVHRFLDKYACVLFEIWWMSIPNRVLLQKCFYFGAMLPVAEKSTTEPTILLNFWRFTLRECTLNAVFHECYTQIRKTWYEHRHGQYMNWFCLKIELSILYL